MVEYQYGDRQKRWMRQWIIFAHAIEKNDFPSDGLVALYDDIAYGDSLGTYCEISQECVCF